MVYFHIFMFLLFQVVANLLFKWGSTASHLYWWGFALGNAVGMSSILFMICMYKAMPAATVVAIATGGTFLLNQIFMFLVYKEKIAPGAMAGLALIFIGVLLTVFLNHAPEAAVPEKTDPAEHTSQPIQEELTNVKR